ncbi:MAG: GAF and ANTAR domain-containing protein [Candidatus Paceibacterota bacterium]
MNKIMKKDIKYYRNELREKQVQIDILRQISETISYSLDLEEILSSIIDVVSGYIESDSCFIYLVDKDNIVLKASQNPHKAALGKIAMKVGEGLTGWAVQHKKEVVIESKAYEDKRFKFFNMLPEDRFEAFVSLPIVFKDKIVGVINVQHTKKMAYEKDKIAFLKIIAKQVGGAIENARLVSETDFLKEALETRKIVEKAKGILMRELSIPEDEAYKIIHKKSMDKRKSIKEIAEAIILSGEILN